MAEEATISRGFDLRGKLVFWLGIAISLAHLWMNSIGNISVLAQNGFHFGSFVLLASLIYPFSNKPWAEKRWAVVLSALVGLMVAIAAIYAVNAENGIYDRGVRLIWSDWLAGSVLILGAIEFTRRTTGWIIPAIIIVALSYIAWWGAIIPGVFRFAGLSLETLMFRSIYGDDALFGNIASISATFVFLFILFGAFLLKSGAGEFIVNISRIAAGRFVGGPGFVAVMASALTGTISGSAVANTASTGVITIPLMKRAGFPKHFAAGVEAAASTGGQLMPPIMGAGAFVMASFTQIPYPTIVAVSVLPAILYFLTVGFFVRIEAKRSKLEMAVDEDAPGFWEAFRNGGPPFIASIGLLMYLLIDGHTPTYAAVYSIITAVVFSWFTPNRMGPKAIAEALAMGARNMVMTAVLLCAVGLVVNVVSTAGIGNTFSLMISAWSGGSLLIALLLVAIASLVLGMGLPVTAAYIVLGTLSAPALNQLILQGQLVAQLVDGTLPEAAKAVLMIAVPDQLAALAAPMSQANAVALVGSLPLDILSPLYQQAIPAEAITMSLLSAHMIIFWLSQDSNVTPPVCLAAFTAAAIADSPPMKTGFFAWKIAKGLYLVPLLIAYTPLLGGDWGLEFEVFFFAVFGAWALSAAIEGHWEHKLGIIERVLVLAVAVGLLWPVAREWHIGALAGFVVLFGRSVMIGRKAREMAAA